MPSTSLGSQNAGRHNAGERLLRGTRQFDVEALVPVLAFNT